MNEKHENGNIYKMNDITYTITYNGSTIEPLCRRMARHSGCYKTYKNGGKWNLVTVYKIVDEFGPASCKIELVELCPCASTLELQRKEWNSQRTVVALIK